MVNTFPASLHRLKPWFQSQGPVGRIVNDFNGKEQFLDTSKRPKHRLLEDTPSLQLCHADRNPPECNKGESKGINPGQEDSLSLDIYFTGVSSDGRFPSQTSDSSYQEVKCGRPQHRALIVKTTSMTGVIVMYY